MGTISAVVPYKNPIYELAKSKGAKFAKLPIIEIKGAQI